MTKIIPISNPDYGQNQITDPDYRSGICGSKITHLGLQIQDYGSGLRIWIKDYKLRLLWNTDRDNFGNYKLKFDQDIPHFYTDNFSRTNDASPRILEIMYFEPV